MSMPDPCGPGKLFAPVHSIHIHTEIPGPKSREILTRLQNASGNRAIPPFPIVVAKAHGALVTDVDGNTFIDFASGANGLIVGHTPEIIVDALQQQADMVTHVYERVGITEDYVHLCELMNEITPDMGGPKKTLLFFCDNPSVWGFAHFAANLFNNRSVNLRYFPGLDIDISMSSVMIRALNEQDFNPLSAEVVKEAVPDYIEKNILLIADEEKTGFGRTGRFFGVENYAVKPDLLLTYGMGAGLKVGAITGRAEIMDAFRSIYNDPMLLYYISEFNPLTCKAAIESINIIRQQNYPQRAIQIGELIRERAAEWQQRWPKVTGIRGLGAMLALELETHELAHEIINQAVQRGLLLANQYPNNLIPLMFPLMIPEEQLNEGLDVLESVLSDCAGA